MTRTPQSISHTIAFGLVKSCEHNVVFHLLLLSRYAFPEVVRLLEASFRYHLTDNSKLPEETSRMIGQPCIAIHLRSSTIDSTVSDEIISISKQFPSIPFFVITSPSQEPWESRDVSLPCIISIHIITTAAADQGCPHSHQPTSSVTKDGMKTKHDCFSFSMKQRTFHSLHELQSHLITISRQ